MCVSPASCYLSLPCLFTFVCSLPYLLAVLHTVPSSSSGTFQPRFGFTSVLVFSGPVPKNDLVRFGGKKTIMVCSDVSLFMLRVPLYSCYSWRKITLNLQTRINNNQLSHRIRAPGSTACLTHPGVALSNTGVLFIQQDQAEPFQATVSSY